LPGYWGLSASGRRCCSPTREMCPHRLTWAHPGFGPPRASARVDFEVLVITRRAAPTAVSVVGHQLASVALAFLFVPIAAFTSAAIW
jgi:hypothetical protein